MTDALEFLAHHGVIHPAPSSGGRTVYHWASDAYPANSVSLRAVGWDNFVIVDLDRDKTIAEMDWHSAHTMLHEQAIYQHDAAQYQVERLDYDNHKAYVRKVEPDYYTTAMTHTKVTVLEEDEQTPTLDLHAGIGEVSVVEKVVGYKKIKFHTHENVGYGDVHLPEMQMHTSAFWLTFPEALVQRFMAARRVDRPSVIDALRGLLNAMHVVGAMGLMIDPRDLGRAMGDRPDADAPLQTGGAGFDPTLFLYDAIPGGIGLAPRLFDEHEALLRRARASLEGCGCEGGCPGCIGPTAGHVGEAALPSRKALVVSLLDFVGLPPLH